MSYMDYSLITSRCPCGALLISVAASLALHIALLAWLTKATTVDHRSLHKSVHQALLIVKPTPTEAESSTAPTGDFPA